ncbi:MAG: PA0069 family radical SAM protein [Planctomycetes bacterium]|nr:PA0069 family radical SAM protein [Planctomycetota bacterium]
MPARPRRVENPPNPWLGAHVEWLDEPPPVELAVYEEDAREILAENDSPDVPFRWSLNPYRGCQHACAYCYARPYHELLGFGAGTDFDSRIVVKRNAAERLAATLTKRTWKRESIAFSGATDCYQPLEASYGLTRGCLEVCERAEQPLGIVTKSALVRRDVDVLARLARRGLAKVFVSIPFADAAQARALEPWAPEPAKRFETLRALSDAGVPTGVSLSPLIPGLNESQIPEILARARDAGARQAFMLLLRLPTSVRPVFEARLRAALPERAERVFAAWGELRAGQSSRSAFGARMRGEGPRWAAIQRLYDLTARRLGYVGIGEERRLEPLAPPEPERPRQGELFG